MNENLKRYLPLLIFLLIAGLGLLLHFVEFRVLIHLLHVGRLGCPVEEISAAAGAAPLTQRTNEA